MGKITAVIAQKRNKKRVSVYIDGEFAVGLDAMTAVKNRLFPGEEIDEERLKAIAAESDAASAFDCALGLVAYRNRTEKEVVRRLTEKGFGRDVALSAAEKLRGYGYCDDFAFCREYVGFSAGKKSRLAIKTELRRLGADEEAIEAALDEAGGEEDAAYFAGEKYMRTHGGADIRKLKGYLYSKGFGGDAINAAAERLRQESAAVEDEEW